MRRATSLMEVRFCFFFSSRRRHTRYWRDWSSDVCSSDLYDCIVLDLKLPKASGFSLLERVKTDDKLRDVPVIIHTGKALTRREETRLKRYAEIGRASCRGKSVDLGGRRIIKKTETRQLGK